MATSDAPAETAERLLVSIDLRSMEVYGEDGRDVYLRALDVHKSDQVNAVFVNGRLCTVDDFELYGELLSFYVTPANGGCCNE